MNQDNLDSGNEDYDCLEYWNKRYETEEAYEWCKDYEILKPFLASCIDRNDSILILGCGNSRLGPSMYDDGYENITCIDYSEVVIDKMKKNYPNLIWTVMDMLDMNFSPSSFDIVIEKATIDVLFVHEKSPWRAVESTVHRVEKTLKNILNCLKPTGKFISITFAQPHFRLPYYKKFWNECNYQTFGDGFHYYFYINNSSSARSNPK